MAEKNDENAQNIRNKIDELTKIILTEEDTCSQYHRYDYIRCKISYSDDIGYAITRYIGSTILLSFRI